MLNTRAAGDEIQANILALLRALLAACGPSPEDLIEQLASSQGREFARQQLLLAKQDAVEPLLAALGDDELTNVRPYLVDVLLSLMMRVDDHRISKRLSQVLQTDLAAEVRARIAHGLGTQGREEAAESLISVLQIAETRGRFEALLALNGLDDKLTDE